MIKKCTKRTNACAVRAKPLFLLIKYADLWRRHIWSVLGLLNVANVLQKRTARQPFNKDSYLKVQHIAQQECAAQ